MLHIPSSLLQANRLKISRLFALLGLLSFPAHSFAQASSSGTQVLSSDIVWTSPSAFSGATYTDPTRKQPLYIYQFPTSSSLAGKEISAVLTSVTSSPISDTLLDLLWAQAPQGLPTVKAKTIETPSGPSLWFAFRPYYFKDGQLHRITSFKLAYTVQEASIATAPSVGARNSSTSRLESGKWLKIGLISDGVYKLDYSFLSANAMGVASTSINVWRIFGKPGGTLPELNSATPYDDLAEIPAKRVDMNGNGQFDPEDYILFYAKGPHSWYVDNSGSKPRYQYKLNPYSDTAYYFVSNMDGAPLQIEQRTFTPTGSIVDIDSYSDNKVYEVDNLTDINRTVKSGSNWFGDEFRALNGTATIERAYSFSFPNALIADSAYLYLHAAGRDKVATDMQAWVDESLVGATSFYATRLFDKDYPYATTGIIKGEFPVKSAAINVTLKYIKQNLDATAWLDKLVLNVPSQLQKMNGQFGFNSPRSTQPSVSYRMQFSGFSSAEEAAATTIWNVTDFYNTHQVAPTYAAGKWSFLTSGAVYGEYVYFDGTNYLAPQAFGTVANQNLHGLDNPDMVIISHPKFFDAANQIAEYRRTHDGFKVHIVSPQQIYNEFSSGTLDPMAVRNFLAMFHKRWQANKSLTKTQYVILLGDASYDFKNRVPNSINYVPTYQNDISTSATDSYCSDDYFACFKVGDGDWTSNSLGSYGDSIYMAIGRFPVTTNEQALQILNKVKHYESPASFGPWRNNAIFTCDDEDGDAFTRQSEIIADDTIGKFYPQINTKKLYSDAFVQQTLSTGTRYPDLNKALTERFQAGALITNYIGHGREIGWAEERILELDEINAYTNFDRLSVVITATCEFGRYDDPERTSGGEAYILNPKGGAAAILTTTRVVYLGQNFDLLRNLFSSNILEKNPTTSKGKTVGEVIMLAKNKVKDDNCRSFSLFGDPATIIALPQYSMAITSVKRQGSSHDFDTLKALSKVLITGNVNEKGNILTDFNGSAFIEVFDKPIERTTLANDPRSSKYPFTDQSQVIYRGTVSVTNGLFQVEFVVPKDISFKDGLGKISLYANSATEDAAGYYNQVVIGGSDPLAEIDLQGPALSLFINDTNFVNGGLTHESPLLLAKIFDENGINAIGSGVGHELVAILDNKQTNVLNEYFTSTLNDFRSGTIAFPYSQLTEGSHSVKVRIWDVHNNPTEATIDFVVASSSQIKIANLLNYPNPAVSNTTFRFEHNRPNRNLNASVTFFDLNGRVIHALTHDFSNSSSVSTFSWDVSNANGGTLATGMYMYSVILTDETTGEKTSATGRILIIK